MNDESSHIITRRRHLKLPKRRWHILGALVVLTLFSAIIYTLFESPAPQNDPFISGDISLPEIQQPLVSTNLNSDFNALPDLLAGDVAEGENPTELKVTQPKTDALGNTIKASDDVPSLTAPKTPEPAGPKTIRIDGQAINGANVEMFSELSQQGPFGPLPRKGVSGKTSFTAYQRAPIRQASGQPLSIIIGGLGINAGITETAISLLPADVTLSFAAQSQGLQGWLNKARKDGHEVMIEIPMESETFNPSEPGATRTLKANNPSANKRHLDWLLSRAQGYFGVTNYNGDKFLTRSDAAAITLNRFSESGLAFISDGAFSTPALETLATSVDLPYKRGFGVIDPVQNKTLIASELSRLTLSAKSGKHPVGIGFAYPETLEALSDWIKTLPNESLYLTPASASIPK